MFVWGSLFRPAHFPHSHVFSSSSGAPDAASSWCSFHRLEFFNFYSVCATLTSTFSFSRSQNWNFLPFASLSSFLILNALLSTSLTGPWLFHRDTTLLSPPVIFFYSLFSMSLIHLLLIFNPLFPAPVLQYPPPSLKPLLVPILPIHHPILLYQPIFHSLIHCPPHLSWIHKSSLVSIIFFLSLSCPVLLL